MEELLQRAVRLHGVRIGLVVDVILDSDGKAIGLDVRCEDGKHRFLPLAAATRVEDEIVVDTPFALLDEDELGFYQERGLALRGRRKPAA